MNKKFDKVFLEFPLVYLSYIGDDPNKLNELLEMQVVDKALKSSNNMTTNFSKVKITDFDYENPIHRKIVIATKMMNIRINSIENAINSWLDFKTYQYAYEEKYGKDAYCRIGKKLTEDVIGGYFGLREYKVLAALQSALGKQKTFLRITYEQISYRMLGYKQKRIAKIEGKDLHILSAHQIKTSVTKLINKKLLICVTYLFREKYYSTKIKRTDVLRDLIGRKKREYFAQVSARNDIEWSRKIQREIRINALNN
ncbi:MAG: hypothetical protein ACYC5G_06080 [Candidatus Doudnabacteria bacterium]